MFLTLVQLTQISLDLKVGTHTELHKPYWTVGLFWQSKSATKNMADTGVT